MEILLFFLYNFIQFSIRILLLDFTIPTRTVFIE